MIGLRFNGYNRNLMFADGTGSLDWIRNCLLSRKANPKAQRPPVTVAQSYGPILVTRLKYLEDLAFAVNEHEGRIQFERDRAHDHALNDRVFMTEDWVDELFIGPEYFVFDFEFHTSEAEEILRWLVVNSKQPYTLYEHPLEEPLWGDELDENGQRPKFEIVRKARIIFDSPKDAFGFKLAWVGRSLTRN